MALMEIYVVLEDGTKICEAYGRARALAQTVAQKNRLVDYAPICR
jgi:hypothetical protein